MQAEVVEEDAVLAERLAVVSGDDEDRAVGDAEVAETVAQPPDLAVDVRHLARVLREREADVAHARQPAGEVRLERQPLQEEAAEATETRSELLAVAVALEVDGVEDERPNVPGGDAELVLQRSHLGRALGEAAARAGDRVKEPVERHAAQYSGDQKGHPVHQR